MLAWTLLLAFCTTCSAETRISLWHQWAGQKRQALRAILDNYSDGSEEVEVVEEISGLAGGAVFEKLLLTAPDRRPHLAMVEREAVPLLADKGLIYPLDDLIEHSNVLNKENWLPSARAYAAYHQHLYGVPVYLNPYLLIYDPQSLSKTNQTLPSSWEDFFRINEQLPIAAASSQKLWTLNTRSIDSIFFILLLQNGITSLDDTEGTKKEEGLKKALTLLRQFREQGLLPPYFKFWDPAFVELDDGRVLFQIEDSTYLAGTRDSAAISPEVAPVPSESGKSITAMSDSPVFVLCRQDRKKEVLDFLQFFFFSGPYKQLEEEFLFVCPLKRGQAYLDQLQPLNLHIMQAAENAASFPLLSPETGIALSHAARSVAKLDAGLLSVEQAAEEILHRDSPGEEQMRISGTSSIPIGENPTKKRNPSNCRRGRFRHLTISWTASTQRIFSKEDQAFQPPPIQITCARNEHEVVQVLVFSKKDVVDISCKKGPFTNATGQTVELPVTLYEEQDTEITTPLVADKPGAYPNILREVQTFGAAPEKPARLWIDFFVPEGTAPGEFSSILRLVHDGCTVEVPISLRVLPLSLPLVPSQPAVIGLNYDLISKHYKLDPQSPEKRSILDSFYWFLVEHRMSPYQPPVLLDSPQFGSYLQDPRVSACRIPFPPSDPGYGRILENAEKGNWLQKLFVYFIDEPTYHQFPAVVRTGKEVHLREQAPKFLVTCFPEESLVGAVDIWCIHMPLLPIGIPHLFLDRPLYLSRVKRQLKAGDTVWWYTAGPIKPFPTLQIEDDPAAFRIIPWLQQLYGLDGLLHWEAANWVQPTDKPFIPLFGNGEGVLVYPGDKQPQPSVRLELLREGLEDMEYLFLLREGLKNVQESLSAEGLGDAGSRRIKEFCRRLIAPAALRANEAGILPLMFFTRDAGAIERVRLEVAEEIINTMQSPRALVLTEPEEKQYTDSETVHVYGVTEPGCAVKINDCFLSAAADGAFSAWLPLHQGTNIFHVSFDNGTSKKTITRKIERL